MPVYASAQSPDRITILENFGDYDYGEPLFIYGQITSILDDSFLIMQIVNPHGDLCQIQQLVPLSNGAFLTDAILLKGRICGLYGEYEIKLFYGDYTKSTTFNVSSDSFAEPTPSQKISLAQNLVSDHASLISEIYDIPLPTSHLTRDLSELESAYVDLWIEFFVDDLIVETDPLLWHTISASLDSVQQLLDKEEITLDIAESIHKRIFAAVFHHEIGDKTKAIDMLSDVFVDIRNVNPEKVANLRTPTFDALEDTLLNLMKKSDTILSRDVKHEIGSIFARGTAPVYSEEIVGLVDILSKSRYLDIVSRQQSDLYRLVQSDWNALKPSFENKNSIEEILSSNTRVSELHQAALILRELDDVERFVSSDSKETSDLVNLIISDWNDLETDLALASSVEDILESESDIYQMSQIIDISSRISKSVEISQANGANSGFVDDWRLLLDGVENAESTDEILDIVSEFDQSMTELREKRNPLIVLYFQYNTMKVKAELQADYENLFLIDNALKILETARQMESGNPSIMRIDRIEVLLTWVSDKAPQIKADLDSFNKDTFKIRAGDVLQRAKSLENLVELSLTKNRFLPNYIEFTEKFNEKIDSVRDLVIQNDLNEADELVHVLFDEWTLVSQAYTNDPNGSSVGYTTDEIKRIEFRKKLDAFSNMVSTFYNNEFTPHADGYNQMMTDAYNLIDIANFVDTESKIIEIGDYLSEYLVLHNPRIIYDISFDVEKDIWVIQGATEKSSFDGREDLYVTIYNMDGTTHSSLKFTDTNQGNFYTQWMAPTEPGLYVVMLQYQNSKATQIVHIEEKFDYKYSRYELNMVDLARDFEELESFAKEFGGENFDNTSQIVLITDKIKSGFVNQDAKSVDASLDEFKKIIERYLPVRSRVAVVEATFDGNKLLISGAVEKALAYREDLFVDVYDQRGNLIEEIALKDDSSGLFSKVLSQSFESGTYVVQLQYHDVIVNDFFSVR